MLKSEAIETIMQAIRIVTQGAQWISPSLLPNEQKVDEKPGLSKRQKNVEAGNPARRIGKL